MKIELEYNEQDAKKLFESFGFEVIIDKVKCAMPKPHGMEAMPETTTGLVVINPDTKDPILLHVAMQRLFQHKMLSDMYFIDKMTVLNAMNCKPVANPFKDILNEVKPNKKDDE